MILPNYVRVRKGWSRAGERARVLGHPVFVEQWWVPVLFDGEEDPDFHKAAAFEEFDCLVNPHGGWVDCPHFISDCVCGGSANLVPEEDCTHCPIPKLEKKARQLQRDLRKAKRKKCHHHPMQVRTADEVRAEIKRRDDEAKEEMYGGKG
jgi:hypothetical protein